jgi:hypothetical protein
MSAVIIAFQKPTQNQWGLTLPPIPECGERGSWVDILFFCWLSDLSANERAFLYSISRLEFLIHPELETLWGIAKRVLRRVPPDDGGRAA